MMIVPASRGDVPAIYAIFDGAVAWLVAKGISGQWGAAPLSQMDADQSRFNRWIDAEIFYVAKLGDQVVGTIILNPAPPHYAAAEWLAMPRQALYIEAFATARAYEGQGIGGRMLAWAADQARAQGINWLRLDCWAGNPDLRAYYARQGFTECGSCKSGETWIGALFEKRLA